MRVLLINPWLPIHPSTVPSFGNAWPLGLLYLAAATKAAGHEVDIYDAAVGGITTCIHKGKFQLINMVNSVPDYPDDISLIGAPIGSLQMILKNQSPEVVGLSLPISSQHAFVPFFVKLIKECTDAKIVVGGPHATLAADLLSKFDGIDYIVMGEGEKSFPELLTAIVNNLPTDGIAGVYPTPFELIEDVDLLPYPAHDLVPRHSYFATTNSPVVEIYSSRGCPFNCRFCSSPYFHRRKWRPHSVLRVLTEIKRLVDSGVKEIRFVDDNAALDGDRWKSIMEGIARSGWGIKLSVYSLYFKTIDKEALTLMRMAGFERVMFAPESGNDRVIRDLMGKNFTVAECEQMVRDITEAKMAPDMNIMLGMVGETAAEIMDTVNFCLRMKEYNPECGAAVSIATPIIHTAMYDEAVERGIFPGGVPQLFSYAVPTYDGEDWTKEQLGNIQRRLDYKMNYETRGKIRKNV